MNAQDVREHMEVIGSCGKLLGHVDRVEGGWIKLTRDSAPDDQHRYIPAGWVARVDEHVHLSRSCGEARRDWSEAPADAVSDTSDKGERPEAPAGADAAATGKSIDAGGQGASRRAATAPSTDEPNAVFGEGAR